jgi:hypothetical protein
MDDGRWTLDDDGGSQHHGRGVEHDKDNHPLQHTQRK